MAVSQTKVQIDKVPGDGIWQCTVNTILNGTPIEIKWSVSAAVLEYATDGQIADMIAPMVIQYADYHKITFTTDDIKVISFKMVKGMRQFTGVNKKKNYSGNPGTVNGKPVSSLAHLLPGVQANVKFPCDCWKLNPEKSQALENVIMHLNDYHTDTISGRSVWSREKIADWLDELHDSGIVNLEFQPWDSEGKDENG